MMNEVERVDETIGIDGVGVVIGNLRMSVR